MNEKIKADWIAALRSDRYKQTTGTLSEGGCFCALGVLCDVVNPNGWSDDGDTHRLEPGSKTSGGFEIAADMLELTGLDNYYSNRIGRLNDDRRMSFAEIADWIEANL